MKPILGSIVALITQSFFVFKARYRYIQNGANALARETIYDVG
mgnify:CR=1 FL=1